MAETAPFRVAQATQRVLIIHQGALGDFICFLPALACLRLAYPEVHVTLMGYPRVLELVDGRFYADRILSVDRADMAFLYQEDREPPASVRDLVGSFQIIGVIAFEGSPLIQNLRKMNMRARLAVVPPFPPEGRRIHMVDHALSFARSLGLSVDDETPRLYLRVEDRQGATAFLNEQGIPSDTSLIALHPGSGSPSKTWPVERFLALAEDLVRGTEARILFIVGPGEEGIREQLSRASRPIAKDLPLPVLGAILERCRVLVGNDSGVSHMAAALGVPVVALFGPTDPAVWAPRGSEVRVIWKGLSCSPCDRAFMSRCPSRRCLLEISREEVYSAVMEAIEKEAGTSAIRMQVRGRGSRAQRPLASSGHKAQ